jgi:hypothetical protein
MLGQHQHPSRYDFVAAPCTACEAATRDRFSTFGSDLVATLSDLT